MKRPYEWEILRAHPMKKYHYKYPHEKSELHSQENGNIGI